MEQYFYIAPFCLLLLFYFCGDFMKGFLLALIGDLLSINALASAVLPSFILNKLNAPKEMNLQAIISSSPLMLFLLLTGIELTLAGFVLSVSGLANKKGNKSFNILGIVLAACPLIFASIAVA